MAEFNCLTHRFSLDVNDTAAQVSLACKRGDTGIQLRIILTDNGIPYEITPGSAAVFTATKPDGTNLYNYCRIEGNTVVYDFTEQTVNVPGQVDVELRLTYGGMVLTSPSFIIIVDETIYDDLVPTSSDEATALTELIGKSEAAVTACESATANATQSASAAEKSAHEADLAADNARGVAQKVQDMLDSGEFQGETTLPVARASSADGIAYTATGNGLPTVQAGSHDTQTDPVGKGLQIVFIPWVKNQNDAPTLQLNGGEIIPIRLRAPQNQSTNFTSPDATLPVPVGALMRGVPYTLTFCGKYWLVDSMPFVGRVDKTAAYTGWTPEDGTAKTVANYAKTLADGSYRIADATIGRYEIDVFTVVNGQQWRILREHDDQFFYISVFCGETISIYVDSETGDVQVGGRTMLTDGHIPLPTSSDSGRLLTVSSNGMPTWADTATVVTDNDPNAVHYTAEEKTDAEKECARANIGAVGVNELAAGNIQCYWRGNTTDVNTALENIDNQTSELSSRIDSKIDNTDVSEIEIVTSATAIIDKDSDTKLITPGGAKKLDALILHVIDNGDGTYTLNEGVDSSGNPQNIKQMLDDAFDNDIPVIAKLNGRYYSFCNKTEQNKRVLFEFSICITSSHAYPDLSTEAFDYATHSIRVRYWKTVEGHTLGEYADCKFILNAQPKFPEKITINGVDCWTAYECIQQMNKP